EVLVRPRPVLPDGCPVPVRTILAATADVRDHVRATTGQPATADLGAVHRRTGDLETAVPAEQCRSTEDSRVADDEIRSPGSVCRRREELAYRDPARSEELRLLLEGFPRRADSAVPQRAGLGESGDRQQVLVGLVLVGTQHLGVIEPGRLGQRCAPPV